jgi:hypothetical protein
MGVMGYVPGGPAAHRPREWLALPGSAYRRPACSSTGQQDTGNLRSQAAAQLQPVLIHPLRQGRRSTDLPLMPPTGFRADGVRGQCRILWPSVAG